MVLGVKRDDGCTVESCRYGIVILRDVVLYELLHDGSTVAGHQSIILGIAEDAVDRCPNGIEAWAVERFCEVALTSKCRKLRQLLVASNILPQRLVSTSLYIRLHRVIVVIVSA